ncbi:MAG: NAD(P)H-dependent oxidoreductase [Nitrososphaeria archaeon]|nr:NAD(P)H-dependent oxidoreductase [Nitrososphaeria archaeon]
MKTKILLINASPRNSGWSQKMLLAANYGVLDAKGEPEILHLYQYDIKPCLGCVSSNPKDCKFPCLIKDDDFNKLGEKIVSAQGLIIATPLYWYMVSGQLKNLIDRLTSMENMIIHVGRSLLDGKVAGFLAVGNDSGSITAISYLMVTFNSMGVHIPPWALAYHHSKTNILDNKEAILNSYNVGYNVTKAAKKVSDIIKWYRSDIQIEKMINRIKEVCDERKENIINTKISYAIEKLKDKIIQQ